MPRLSILIPNFDNGRQSATDGRTDLIGILLRSLRDTLAEDPTPREIIAYDDGSTDDSLDTLRRWSEETGPDGKPFLRLIEAEHSGVLSVNANKLVAASSGDILVRLDGDIEVLTPNWADKLVRVFDQNPASLGVVGPKQLQPSMKIHSFGDFILHPRGYHHLGFGLPRDTFDRPVEVDHVMGCFYCCRRAVHDTLNGYDEDILRGQTIDFGLRARQAGYRAIAVPHIEFIHRHGLRSPRRTRADTSEGLHHTLDLFRDKWGFSRIAPDLEAVRERYAGSPLLWNAQVFGLPPGEDAAETTGRPELEPKDTDWGRYASDPAFHQAMDYRANIVANFHKALGKPERLGMIGGGVGLIPYLLAQRGIAVTACERDPARLALARRVIDSSRKQASPSTPWPELVHQARPEVLPFGDGTFNAIALVDRLSADANPAGLLGRARRLLGSGGAMLVLEEQDDDRLPRLGAGRFRYRAKELFGQVAEATGLVLTHRALPEGRDPTLVVARDPGPGAKESVDEAGAGALGYAKPDNPVVSDVSGQT